MLNLLFLIDKNYLINYYVKGKVILIAVEFSRRNEGNRYVQNRNDIFLKHYSYYYFLGQFV